MHSLWLMSALFNAIGAIIVIWFMVRITHGAGWKCRVALERLFHRLSLMALAFTMLMLALAQIRDRSIAVDEWAFFEMAFFATLAVSFWRHLSAPKALPDAGWGKHVDTVFRVR